ncbi:HK97 gp10 family phage protein [Enterococcus hulanensis]|uniref:HK97 gp10 family phage protein n=1 Tax=Enterococcus hulanensis TaxID=2559929 RepID=UPI002890F127|nr:HK97 gp10 family phage protein [Enterococcus hulanensis]MDT2662951.1 HK97 gp10 family phage protein [Enterococcus hulanensis]
MGKDISIVSNADKVIENFKKMTKLAEQEGIAFVNDSMNKIVSTAKPLTPVKSGDLRRGYRVQEARLLSTGRIVGAVRNNEKYFKYVEEGHRTRSGGFVKGRFMLTRATNLAHMSYIPRRFKQMAIRIVKKG